MGEITELILDIHRTRCNIQGCVYGVKLGDKEESDTCIYCKRTKKQIIWEQMNGLR